MRDLARRLAERADAVCRTYLSAGRREGNYWLVGDARNTPGRSMFVRLLDAPARPAGKWMDAATGEHGDLIDVIREALHLATLADAAAEARRFLGVPSRPAVPEAQMALPQSAPAPSARSARRLLSMARGIRGTPVETYLRKRGITDLRETGSLRFHPRCYWRAGAHASPETWPAMVAAVTTFSGEIVGAHRTWLARDGSAKAPVNPPRKAMGHLLGQAVRFGHADDVLAAGEGIETVLSVHQLLPELPAAAALSANHLACFLFPPALRRLYVLRDNDDAGRRASDRLIARATANGIEATALSPRLGDFNDDLRAFSIDALREDLAHHLALQDIERFITASDRAPSAPSGPC